MSGTITSLNRFPIAPQRSFVKSLAPSSAPPRLPMTSPRTPPALDMAVVMPRAVEDTARNEPMAVTAAVNGVDSAAPMTAATAPTPATTPERSMSPPMRPPTAPRIAPSTFGSSALTKSSAPLTASRIARVNGSTAMLALMKNSPMFLARSPMAGATFLTLERNWSNLALEPRAFAHSSKRPVASMRYCESS